MSSPTKNHYARGRERRSELVQAAVQVIAERGLERVTFRAVSEQAGFAPSTTSYFFKSVDDIIDAAITHVAESVTATVNDLVVKAQSGVLSRSQFVDALVSLVSAPQDGDSAAQFEAYLAASRRPALASTVASIMDVIEAVTETALRELGVSNPRLPARQFVALIDGFTLHRLARPERTGSEPLLREAMVRLLDSYLAGEGTAPS